MWGRMGVERKETKIDSILSPQKGCWEGEVLTFVKRVREITMCLFMVKNKTKLPSNFQDNDPL